MKRTALFSIMIAVIAAFTFTANAQSDKKEKRQHFNPEQMVQMRAQKIAEKLQLDDATTSKFIETYKAYLKDTHNVYVKYGQKMHGKKNDKKERKTDAEVEQEIKNQFAMSRALIDVRENYYTKFRAFLNPHQIKKVYSQEREEFKRMDGEKDRRFRDGMRKPHGSKPYDMNRNKAPRDSKMQKDEQK